MKNLLSPVHVPHLHTGTKYTYKAPSTSGSCSLGEGGGAASRAVDGVTLLHGPLRVDCHTETERRSRHEQIAFSDA